MAISPNPTFDNVTLCCKANIYFDGKVVSYDVRCADGARKSVGLIHPGSFHFKTSAQERMDVIAGSCRVRLAGAAEWASFAVGTSFLVPADSFFDISVDHGLTEYVCSYGPDAAVAG